MITDSYDNLTEAKINPCRRPDAEKVNACIITFSHVIEEYVLDNFEHEQIGRSAAVTGDLPIWRIRYKGKSFAFMKTYAGAPACTATVEDTLSEIITDKYVIFGGAGCLNKEIAIGKMMIPTFAYRDEGTSYHYAPPADYIKIKNAEKVAEFAGKVGIPYALGKTWTTDAIYRETVGNFEKRKADGCISVEMECAAVEAVCDFRGRDLYVFFTSGDLLDAPVWENRLVEGVMAGTQHDSGHFDIALALADYITE